jgi:hypothetical protein
MSLYPERCLQLNSNWWGLKRFSKCAASTDTYMQCMQTYKDATVYPGPRLNLVLGPNGAIFLVSPNYRFW